MKVDWQIKKMKRLMSRLRKETPSPMAMAEYCLSRRCHPSYAEIKALLLPSEHEAFDLLLMESESAKRRKISLSDVMSQQKATERALALAREKKAKTAHTLTLKRIAGEEDASLFLVTLAHTLFDQLANKGERAAVISLRKASVKKSRARKIIGCTAIELDRWDADGRCPHAFTMLNPRRGGNAQSRKWLLPTLELAEKNRDTWRLIDKSSLPVFTGSAKICAS